MRRSVSNSNLTKSYIESKVSQVAIMSKYLDIPAETIVDCINKKKLIHSVFRDDDRNGSMGFAINKANRLKVRDFGGFGFWGDIYDVVAYVLSLVYERKIEPNNKQDFYFILKHIAYTFSDIIDNKEVDPLLDSQFKEAIIKGQKKRKVIEIVPRSWNKKDKEYWNGIGVNLNYLNTHFVIPVEQYYIDRSADSEPKYYYKDKDPCYAYILGQDRKGIYLIKLYFPKRNRDTELKFITNCNVIEGVMNLERDNYDYIIITKSTKDRLSLGNHLSNNIFYGGDDSRLTIGIVNLPSENYELKQNEYDWLNAKLSPTGKIISFLDFDGTGRHGARYLKDTYDIPYIFITRGEFGLPNLHCKDFSDLHERYSISEINNFIKDTIKYVELRYREGIDTSSTNGIYDSGLPY